jgi:hypothetical protein
MIIFDILSYPLSRLFFHHNLHKTPPNLSLTQLPYTFSSSHTPSPYTPENKESRPGSQSQAAGSAVCTALPQSLYSRATSCALLGWSTARVAPTPSAMQLVGRGFIIPLPHFLPGWQLTANNMLCQSIFQQSVN